MKFSPKCKECGDTIELGIGWYFLVDEAYFLLIDEPYIDVDGGKLHKRCFKCSSCNVSLYNQRYYDHNDAHYCQKCDREQFCPKCTRCGAAIPRGI